MARIVIQLKAQERDALRLLAEREFRDPRAQAALIIRRALESAGLLAAEGNGSEPQPAAQPVEPALREVSHDDAPA